MFRIGCFIGEGEPFNSVFLTYGLIKWEKFLVYRKRSSDFGFSLVFASDKNTVFRQFIGTANAFYGVQCQKYGFICLWSPIKLLIILVLSELHPASVCFCTI